MSAQTEQVIRSYVCDKAVTKYGLVSMTAAGPTDGLVGNAASPAIATEIFVGVALEDGSAGDRISVVVQGPALALVHTITEAGQLMVDAVNAGHATTFAGAGNNTCVGYYHGNETVWAAGGPADGSVQEIIVAPVLTGLL